MGFEEKAEILINSALNNKETYEFQQAWLLTIAALSQNIGDRVLPISLGRLSMSELRYGIFPWNWSSPDLASHSNIINSVSISPDGTKIAAGAFEVIRMWDSQTGKELAVFKGHLANVYSVSFNPDGRLIASGSSDNTVRLWNLDLVNAFLKDRKEAPPLQKNLRTVRSHDPLAIKRYKNGKTQTALHPLTRQTPALEST